MADSGFQILPCSFRLLSPFSDSHGDGWWRHELLAAQQRGLAAARRAVNHERLMGVVVQISMDRLEMPFPADERIRGRSFLAEASMFAAFEFQFPRRDHGRV